MNDLLSNILIKINPNVYDKNPEESDLGRKIVKESIKLIDKIGFEHFTFKKLSVQIKTSEASIYRYFSSKHRLLVYLTSWYWSWLEYKLVFSLFNISSPNEKLNIAIKLITEETQQDGNFSHIDEIILHKIVISESSKAYLIKEVDEENKSGLFKPYKNLVERVSQIILEINPDFKYPHMLVSTIIEGSHHQRYFAEHLPKLTDNIKGEDSIVNFYLNMTFATIEKG